MEQKYSQPPETIGNLSPADLDKLGIKAPRGQMAIGKNLETVLKMLEDKKEPT